MNLVITPAMLALLAATTFSLLLLFPLALPSKAVSEILDEYRVENFEENDASHHKLVEKIKAHLENEGYAAKPHLGTQKAGSTYFTALVKKESGELVGFMDATLFEILIPGRHDFKTRGYWLIGEHDEEQAVELAKLLIEGSVVYTRKIRGGAMHYNLPRVDELEGQGTAEHIRREELKKLVDETFSSGAWMVKIH